MIEYVVVDCSFDNDQIVLVAFTGMLAKFLIIEMYDCFRAGFRKIMIIGKR